MYIYVLTRYLDHPKAQGYDWDCASEFVIRAKTPKRARQIAATRAGDEGSEPWLDRKQSSCKLLKSEGKECVIVIDFYEA